MRKRKPATTRRGKGKTGTCPPQGAGMSARREASQVPVQSRNAVNVSEHGNKRWFDRLERITLWVGAVCGIVVAMSSLWEKVTEPTPPDLAVAFAFTGTPSITIITPDKATSLFPLDLVVRNTGRLTARDVRLKLVDSKLHSGDRTLRPIKTNRPYVTMDELLDAGLYPAYTSELTIETNKSVFKQNSLYVGESVNTMTTVPLGEIHPGEGSFLEAILQARLSTNHAPILGSGPPRPVDIKIPTKHHRIVAWISAENFPEKEISLHVIIEQLENVARNGSLTFVVKDGELFRNEQQ